MKKKGFTLVELLAVIVILAVIALIATPQILKLIENARKEAFKDTALGIMESAVQNYTKNSLDKDSGEIEYNFSSGSNVGLLDVKGEIPKGGYLKITGEGQIEMIIHNGKYCAKKKPEEEIMVSKYSEETCKTEYIEQILNGADPQVKKGMIPIKYENNKPIKADTLKEWYSYSKKEWANVVIVKPEKLDTYKNATEGSEIKEEDILGYLVWIPRYRYKLFNVAGTASTSPQTIEIEFEDKNTKKSEGTKNGEYYTAPGFSIGGEENGYWIGKFETTGSEAKPTILPNVIALRNQMVSQQFETSQKFNEKSVYGIEGDAHMSQNDEWGAVAYLSHSKYGINGEVRINNNNTYKTGCGAQTENGAAVSSCAIEYGKASSYPQSTTGNIYGVFDMSGGSWEYQMNVLADSEGKGYSGRNNLTNSGYNGKFSSPGSDTSNASIVEMKTGKDWPGQRYYTLYKSGNWETACDGMKCIGDSLNETGKWYDDHNSFVSVRPWLVRGGTISNGVSAGVFGFHEYSGQGNGSCSFRVVVSP